MPISNCPVHQSVSLNRFLTPRAETAPTVCLVQVASGEAQGTPEHLLFLVTGQKRGC